MENKSADVGQSERIKIIDRSSKPYTHTYRHTHTHTQITITNNSIEKIKLKKIYIFKNSRLEIK